MSNIGMRRLRCTARERLQAIFRLLKIKSLCRPSLSNLDRQLEKHLDFDGGVFIEAGAFNGIAQSNTYYFEAIRKWRGLLIEPTPELYTRCIKNRPTAKVINAALVGPDWSEPTIELSYAGLMSIANDKMKNPLYSKERVKEGLRVQKIDEGYKFDARAITLSDAIDESGLPEIDLLSLDVEGFESEALKGLNLERHSPKFMCIEVRDRAEIEAVISSNFEYLECLSENKTYRDILYVRKDLAKSSRADLRL